MNFVWESFSPKENASYGEEKAKGSAHLAVRDLFYRRIREGKKQEEIAAAIGKDPAWLSRTMKGPANWTLKTLGALVIALDGELKIQVSASEDIAVNNLTNFDAYLMIDEVCLVEPTRLEPYDATENSSFQEVKDKYSYPHQFSNNNDKTSIVSWG